MTDQNGDSSAPSIYSGQPNPLASKVTTGFRFSGGKGQADLPKQDAPKKMDILCAECLEMPFHKVQTLRTLYDITDPAFGLENCGYDWVRFKKCGYGRVYTETSRK